MKTKKGCIFQSADQGNNSKLLRHVIHNKAKEKENLCFYPHRIKL